MNSKGRNFFGRLRALSEILRSTFKTTGQFRKHRGDAAMARKISQEWASAVLHASRVEVVVKGKAYTDSPCLYVSNHISYLDIPVLISLAPLVFVAKKEIASWPIFGPATAASGAIFIDRASRKARSDVTLTLSRAIMEERKSVGLFPEGTTSITGKPWSKSIFRMAREHGFYVQPIRIHYEPLRSAAFIDDDALLPHIWQMLGNEQIRCTVEFFDARKIAQPLADGREMESLVHKSFESALK